MEENVNQQNPIQQTSEQLPKQPVKLVENQTNAQVSKPSGKSKLPILIVAFVLLIILGSGAYYLLNQSKNSNQQKQASVAPTITTIPPTPTIYYVESKLIDSTIIIDNATGWRKYTDSVLKFSIEVPQQGYCFSSEKCIYKYGDAYTDVGISRFTKPSNIDLKTFISKNFGDTQLKISFQSISVDGSPAYEVRGLAVGQARDGLDVYIQKENYFYRIGFLSWVQPLQAQYKDILSTFKFTDQLTPTLSTSKYDWVTISNSESANWKSFTKYGFTLKYPPNWHEDTSLNYNDLITILTPQASCPTGVGCAGRESGIYIYFLDAKQKLTTRDYISQYVIPLEKNAPSIPIIIDNQPNYFSNIDATVVDGFSGAGNPGPTAFIYNRTINNLGNKIIELSSDGIDNDTVSKIFSTFKFTN